jgi:molybdenum cofactor cytidylyltransferase
MVDHAAVSAASNRGPGKVLFCLRKRNANLYSLRPAAEDFFRQQTTVSGRTLGLMSQTFAKRASRDVRCPLFCVVLAAGASRRFGSTKQLAEFQGQPLVTRAVRLAEELTAQCSLLVAGNEWRRVAAACAPLAGYLVVNPEFNRGLGESIAAGVAVVAHTAKGVLLLLADQPLIEAAHLGAMRDRWQATPECIVASEFQGILAPPVLFPASCFAELAALRGDNGARPVLQKHASRVIRLPCASAAVDIDLPADFDALG